ncbi:MAG: 3-dehydroquinate synthase [Oscillospiraceae bacterium]|nr:3-dehydroquinate synthase [Oscillospiraceae bacterium]MDE6776780.1 3-dehydroquinate synthase [Oscillospiraceae bacterium]MDE7093908.1 3-dehydroquinate synthase [Oscillospiraceae bacterium]
MQKIHVPVKNAYDVIIERGILQKCGTFIQELELTNAKHFVIITDDNVDKFYADIVLKSLQDNGFQAEKFVFPHGEASKNAEILLKIYAFLCEHEVTRGDCLIALGGGVVGDITGFAAATFLRGLPYIQIPTSLLAQVDSSVGGKTAIDLPEGKNLVGAFKQPLAVFCDLDTLQTLPEEFLIDGMGEVIKYGMIADAELFENLCQYDLQSIKNHFDEIIPACIKIKRDVVAEDELDTGLRMILNFGHTLGHAIEAYYHYETYTHGCAVAVGMCLMTKYCGSPEDYKKLKSCVERYGLPTEVPASIHELIALCGNDKKRSGSDLRYIVCSPIGTANIKLDSVSEFQKHFERVI